MKIKERILWILRIIGWGLIIAGIIFTILMALGFISSPSELAVSNLLTTGILALFLEMRVKFESVRTKFALVWSDFKKRKKI